MPPFSSFSPPSPPFVFLSLFPSLCSQCLKYSDPPQPPPPTDFLAIFHRKLVFLEPPSRAPSKGNGQWRGGARGGVLWGKKAAPMPPNPHGNPQPHWEGKFPTVNCEKIAERDSGFGALGEIRAASVRNSESGRAFSHRSTKFRAGTGAPLLVFGRGELFPGFVRIWVKQKNLYLFVYFANIPPSPPLPSPPL